MFILIADDEKMIRLSLQSMLEELYPGEHMYLHAANGKAAVAQVEKLPPDIAFLDIRMPLMNGLEALEQCLSLSPSTTWIILSGYAEFEYAQKAITLSAYSYLLKPVDTVTLKELVDGITLVKQRENAHHNKLFTLDIIRSFNMADQLGPDEFPLLPYPDGDYRIYMIYIDNQTKDVQHNLKFALYHALDAFCQENLSVVYHALFFNMNGELCLVCSVQDASHLTFFVDSQIRKHPDNIISVFSGTSDSLSGLYEVSRKITGLSDIRLVYDCRRTTPLETLPGRLPMEDLLYFSRQLTLLLRNALAGNPETVRQLTASFSQDVRMRETFAGTDRRILYPYLSDILKQPFFADRFSDFLQELCRRCIDLNRSDGFHTFDVTAIKDFVCQNYGHDVGISYVSELFNLSPAYFSKLFHEKSGQKYIDYVTEVRMENAKKILRENPDLPVKKAAEAVGYTSVRHFSRTFQKYTGTLPSNF